MCGCFGESDDRLPQTAGEAKDPHNPGMPRADSTGW